MTQFIEIDVSYGNPSVTQEDTNRAIKAAKAVLDGHDYMAVQAEYQRQLDLYDCETPMDGLARLWAEATSAANIALTEGWNDPNGAGCTIYAWERK